MLQPRFPRRGLDGTVESALRIVAGYTPKDKTPRFVVRPEKPRAKTIQVRVEGGTAAKWATKTAAILGQTVRSSAFQFRPSLAMFSF